MEDLEELGVTTKPKKDGNGDAPEHHSEGQIQQSNPELNKN